ncbi:MAG: riboflavin biosynthesis protein RibF [Chloroflexi bacterium]|nr:riboflavin biosynthesis protein RibF [Chloroflexota bacterium]
MAITELLAPVEASTGPTVATIGTFDGVHLGHRALLRKVKLEAEARGARSLALVFKQQPRSIIKPDSKTTYLCDFETRQKLLSEFEIDEIAALEFSPEFQKLPSDEFVGKLRERVGLQALVLGPGAKIGADLAGVSDLSSSASRVLDGVEFIEVAGEIIDGKTVSSSAIRSAIAEGLCETAAAMLGRNYAISGVVGSGEKRGRDLGFPTANIELESPVTVPQNGIYATYAHVDGNRYRSATSIGVRPTFETDGGRTIEAFLLDFNGDLYTKRLRLEFVTRLRSEVAFESAEQLIEQMNRDVEQTRQLLAT